MVHEEHALRTAPGTELFAQRWVPTGRPRASLALIHGFGEHTGRYAHVGMFLAGQGYALCGVDLHGHGRSGGRRGYTSRIQMLDTVDLLVRDAKARFPGAPVFLYGHSMGGAIALIHGLTRSASVAGVIATSPLIRLAGRTPAVKVAAAKLLARVAPSFLMKNPLDLDALSRDQSVAGAVRGDPLYHNIVSTRLGCDIMEWGPWFESQSGPFPLPLLMMSGSQDRIVNTSATSALAGRLTGDVTHKVWEGNYHELHNEPEREEILGFLAQWLKVNAPAAPGRNAPAAPGRQRA